MTFLETKELRARLADWLQRHRDDGDFEEGEGGKEARSYLMDRSVLEAHEHLAVPDETSEPSFDASLLTREESAVWEWLRDRRLRLEQERIPMAVVLRSFAQ